MNQLEMMEHAASVNEALVAGLREEQLADPTPCAEWDVRQLLNHLVGGAQMFGLAAARRPMPEGGLPEDLLGSDPLAAWREAARINLDGWRGEGAMEGTVQLPFGEMPVPMALGINLLELCVHGWDLAHATGQDYAIDPEVAEAVLAFSRGMVDDSVRQQGIFGPEHPVAADAPAVDRLAAFLGRQPS